MNKSKFPELQCVVRKVVQTAAEPGGAIDSGEFSFATARAAVTRRMGFAAGTLDGEWKKIVKEEVNKALDSLNDASAQGESSTSSVASASPPPRKKSRRKPSPSPEPEPEPQPESEAEEAIEVPSGSGDESEMSSVYDAPPKARTSKKRKSEEDHSVKKEMAGKSGTKGAKAKKSRGKKDPNEGLSREEAKAADLKRIVHACGVRKQWSKEFERSPTAHAQILILQEILKGLGMEGKLTLNKAKTIKEARELATELDEVKEFEKARGMSAGGRTRRSDEKKNYSQQPIEDEPEQRGAVNAVMAFLQDEESD